MPLFENLRSIRESGHLVQRVEKHAVVGLAVENRPQLLGGEAEDRRHEPDERMRDVPKGGLRRASRVRLGGTGIEPVLQDVEVEAAEILGAEGLQLLRDEMELVGGIVAGDLLLQLGGQG